MTITATVKYGDRATVIQEDMDILLSTHLGTAEAGNVGTLERISIVKYTDRASATIRTHRDGDGDDETFAVLIRWIPKRDLARVGHPAIVWVTITEGDAPPPESVPLVPQVQAGGSNGTLHLSWNDAYNEHDGYDVQYKHSSAANESATTTDDPATGWVDAGHTGLERSLTNWVDYDVRVRPTFPGGPCRWSDVVTAYPAEPVQLGEPRAVTVTVSDTTAEEGETVTLTATLDERAPRGGGHGAVLGLRQHHRRHGERGAGLERLPVRASATAWVSHHRFATAPITSGRAGPRRRQRCWWCAATATRARRASACTPPPTCRTPTTSTAAGP